MALRTEVTWEDTHCDFCFATIARGEMMHLLPVRRTGPAASALCATCAAPEYERCRNLAHLEEPERTEMSRAVRTDEQWTAWREDMRMRGISRAVEQYARLKTQVESGYIDRVLAGDERELALQRLAIQNAVEASIGDPPEPGCN